MSAWRWPTRDEERAHTVQLRRLLGDEVARKIAAMPILVPGSTIPFAIRCDAWLWRTRLDRRDVATVRPEDPA